MLALLPPTHHFPSKLTEGGERNSGMNPCDVTGAACRPPFRATK